MLRVRLKGIESRAELRNYISSSGCYTREENERIYDKWFAEAPRYLFKAVNEKYRLTDKILCDAGCGYGANLVFCNPDSYGIEIEGYEVQFARSIGLNIYERDILNDDLSALPKADAIWNSAVLEHVTSPHIFLRKLHSLLKDGGLLAIYVPTIPPLRFLQHLPRLGRYFTGHVHGDHINAFTPTTLRFFCERAGFRTLEVSAFYPGALSILNGVPIIDGCVYVGIKQPHWEYPANATRRASQNAEGFEWVGQKFDK